MTVEERPTGETCNDHVVVPTLYPVLKDEVDALAAIHIVPIPLREFWLRSGCGSFATGAGGRKLTDFQNRLIGPDEVLELKAEGAFPDIDPFEVGIPFFETADLYFLVLKEDGAVYHQGGIHRAEPLRLYREGLGRAALLA